MTRERQDSVDEQDFRVQESKSSYWLRILCRYKTMVVLPLLVIIHLWIVNQSVKSVPQPFILKYPLEQSQLERKGYYPSRFNKMGILTWQHFNPLKPQTGFFLDNETADESFVVISLLFVPKNQSLPIKLDAEMLLKLYTLDVFYIDDGQSNQTTKKVFYPTQFTSCNNLDYCNIDNLETKKQKLKLQIFSRNHTALSRTFIALLETSLKNPLFLSIRYTDKFDLMTLNSDYLRGQLKRDQQLYEEDGRSTVKSDQESIKLSSNVADVIIQGHVLNPQYQAEIQNYSCFYFILSLFLAFLYIRLNKWQHIRDNDGIFISVLAIIYYNPLQYILPTSFSYFNLIVGIIFKTVCVMSLLVNWIIQNILFQNYNKRRHSLQQQIEKIIIVSMFTVILWILTLGSYLFHQSRVFKGLSTYQQTQIQKDRLFTIITMITYLGFMLPPLLQSIFRPHLLQKMQQNDKNVYFLKVFFITVGILLSELNYCDPCFYLRPQHRVVDAAFSSFIYCWWYLNSNVQKQKGTIKKKTNSKSMKITNIQIEENNTSQ